MFSDYVRYPVVCILYALFKCIFSWMGNHSRMLRNPPFLFLLSHVRGSVTYNNGFWIGWLDLLMPSFTITLNYSQLQQLTISLLPRTHSILVLLSQFFYSFWTQLLNLTTEFTVRSHVSSLYNFGENWIEITTSNNSSTLACAFVAVETGLASRCLAMDVSVVLLWLHTSGVQASCPSM
jgi:hypothetical protein